MASFISRLLLGVLMSTLAPACASDTTKTQPVSQFHSPGAKQDRGTGPPFENADVVIVFDRSSAALLASGFDVDKDGTVGRNLRSPRAIVRMPVPAKSWTTDAGDTVEALQLEIARALIPRLAARNNRIGMASFTLRARRNDTGDIRLHDESVLMVPVGPAHLVLEALSDLPPVRERRHSDLARLIQLAGDALHETPSDSKRPRVILLLSAGETVLPDGVHWSRKRSIAVRGQLAARGIELWAIPLGIANIPILEELTRTTGGQVLGLDELDRVFTPSSATPSSTPTPGPRDRVGAGEPRSDG